MNKNKKIILGLVAGILVLSGLVWFAFFGNSETFNFSDSSFGFLKSIQPITTIQTPIVTTSSVRVGDAKKNTPLYVEVLAKFGGNRLQFSNNCTSVSPSGFVIKSGVQFMIDNRDSKAHTFSFSGQKYNVSDYGYAVVNTPKIGDQPVLCDDVQRVKVNVQK